MQSRRINISYSILRPILRSFCAASSCVLIFTLSGCNGTKFLKEGESFYTGAEIKLVPQGDIPGEKRIKTMLQTFIKPAPNAKIFGNRTSVWFYYLAGDNSKKKGIRNFIQTKLGSPPVLLKDATPEKTAKVLEQQINNDGYFKSTVASSVETKKKESKVIYTVILQPPFKIGNLNYIAFDTTSVMGKNILNERLLRKNQRYQLERLQAEQQRIEEVVKNHGLFYFDNRYLLFNGDSTVGQRQVDLDLVFERGTPDKITRPYKITEINVYPSYSLGDGNGRRTRRNRRDTTNAVSGEGSDSIRVARRERLDTIQVDGYNYIDRNHDFRPEIITNVIKIRPDSLYRKIDHEYSLIHLMGLKTFKYVNIKFTEKDSSSLRADIFMTPLLRKSVRAQVELVSKSNNFVGPGVELTFTNRNIFRGAEMFQFKVHSAYEVQLSRQQSTNLNSFEIGAEASLSVPRFITPLHIRYNSQKFLPSTQFKIGYNFQERVSYFSLRTFNIAGGYTWRETTLKTHELFPVDISYIKSGNKSDEFNKLLDGNPVLKNSFQDQFILGTRYSFTINTQFTEDVEEKFRLKARKKSNFYFKGTIDVSGNLFHALQNMGKEKSDSLKLFGSPYSQYARADVDFRYYLLTGKASNKNMLATRLIVGVGNAYGNSNNMPYIKQFSIGGSNSIRAFPARSLGPGTYNVRNDTSVNSAFIDQRADIKLEGNVEYRFGLLSALKGAVFLDAGNIWLWKPDPDKADGTPSRPGGAFDKNKFISEIAVGTGFGLRYDFSFFILRFDLAFPLRKPYLPESERWVLDKIDFGSSDWRSQNLVFNIAIGYPF
ncbi:BamA/TamA family outer membrane protein [soil metagenome]